MVSWTVGGLRVALIATNGRNEQQWYAYDRTNFCTLGKTSGAGNSRNFGLLNVFKWSRCCKPVVGNFAKMLLPKFKSSKRSKFLNASSSMKLISLPSKSLEIRCLFRGNYLNTFNFTTHNNCNFAIPSKASYGIEVILLYDISKSFKLCKPLNGFPVIL